MKHASAFLASGASAFALAASPAAAAPPLPMLAAAPHSWTGFYIGAGGGLAFLNVRSSSDSYLSDYINDMFASGGQHSDLGKFGVFGTIEAGGDWQINSQFVIGAFVDFDLRSLTARRNSDGYASGYTSTWASEQVWYKVHNGWDAGARLGYLVSDRNLVYALGGVTGAQVSSGVRLDQYYNGGQLWNSIASSQSGWKTGWMLGVGWETALTDHIFLKTEYRYQDYGRAASYASNPYGGARQSGDIAVHSVRAVLDYRF